jgi:PAS domain S-box-containing protein
MNNNDRTGTSRDDGQRLRLQEVEALANFGTWYTDLERDETEWSPMACEIFGVSEDEGLFGHEDVPTLVASSHEEVVKQKRNAVFNGEPLDIEYQIEVNGSTKWIHERAEVKHDDSGEPVAAIGILQDITDHKEHERELELFRNLVDNASDGVFVIDSETSDIIDVNEMACQMLGYDRDELVSLSVPDINPKFSTEMWKDFAAGVRESGTEVVEGKHQRKDGTTFPVEIRISFVSLDQEYHVATVRNVTERKEREQRLEAARKRYQTLIDAAPDPIFVADADTGKIVEANASAADIRDQPRDEIVGLHQAELHPDGESERYQELFEYHVQHPETIKEFGDGTPVYLTTVDGKQIPVAISTSTVSLDDRTLIHGIFRNISEQRRYEKALTGINTTAQDLLQAETDTEIAQIVVDATTDLLNVSGSGVCLYDDHSGKLVPTAYSERLENLFDEIPHFSPGNSIAWRVFTDQEQAQFEDVRTADDVYNAGTPIRSELLIPLGKHGVFLVGDTSMDAFDDMTEEIAETIASTAEAALNRAQRTQTLRKRERESQMQAERLKRVNQLNDEIRTIMQALIQTQSRGAIIQRVCDSLVSLDRFTYAWIGEPDPESSELYSIAQAGTPKQYLDMVSLDFEDSNTLPAVRAAKKRTTITEPRIATAPQQAEWRDTALRHEFQSVISVPLVYDEFLYGAMTIYSDQPEAFDDRTQSVLTELGKLVGYAINASEQRNALLGRDTVDVTFDLTGTADTFVELATRVSSDIRIENITPRGDGEYLIHFGCDENEPERVQAVAEDLPSIVELRVISETDQTVYETVLIGDCLVATLATVGVNIRSVVVSEMHCRVRASLSEGRKKQILVRHLKDEYSDIEVAIHRYNTSSPSISWGELLDTSLTDRQWDILTTAYYSGFFDKQRKQTGAEIAELLDISQPAFSTQLRAAQRNLFDTIFDDKSK